ncbi:MAG: hypothetical protein RL226_1180 [Bacteroidota bacterium]|jgi:hypothetical protein
MKTFLNLLFTLIAAAFPMLMLAQDLASNTLWTDFTHLPELTWRFSIHLLIVWILVRLIYYPLAKRKDYLFTYILISISVFLLCFLLANVKIDLAFALGLFAIFGIIRYRTDAIPIKEMTYLFIVIGLSVMNALASGFSFPVLLIANLVILIATFGLEKIWLLRHESYKVILYERIDLIKAGNREALKADLEERTGIRINRVEVGRIDFLRDTAQIRIYFYADAQLDHFEEQPGGRD